MGTGETLKRPSILLVDDEPDILDLLEMELTEDDFQVYTANGGEQAYSIIQKSSSPITFCLSDIHMPHGDGPALLALIQKNFPPEKAPKMIFMTAYRPDIEESLLKLGANGVIFKPFTYEDLKKLLRRIQKGQ